MNITNVVKQIEPEIITNRRELHKIPELGLELPKTVAYVKAQLDAMAIPYQELVNGNALVGLIKGGHLGKTLAIRADMDGLPIQEETGLEFTSQTGNMHACGHDGHTAMLLGAARILSENKHLLHGNVKLLFQPGEEFPGGAKPMIDEGCMENPPVDAVIGLHEGHINDIVKPGDIGVSYGKAMASMDRILLRVIGRGVHGAYPEQGVDPIVIAAEIISSLQRIISREINAADNGLISICRIQGGFNQNIIPDVVEMEGTVRATDPTVRQKLARRIDEVARGIAQTFNAQCEVTYDFKYPPLVNDRAFTEKFVESAKKIIDPERIMTIEKPIMGGEDMAYFLEKAPGTFFFLANPREIDGKYWPHHNSRFDVDESQLWLGSALFVQTALDYLAN